MVWIWPRPWLLQPTFTKTDRRFLMYFLSFPGQQRCVFSSLSLKEGWLRDKSCTCILACLVSPIQKCARSKAVVWSFHEWLVSLWNVLSSKRNVFYQHFLVAHSTHILCKWEAIGNEDEKRCRVCSLKLTGQDEVMNDKKLLNVATRPPMKGNPSVPHPASLFEEHKKGCEQKFVFILWYLNDSTSTMFDTIALLHSLGKNTCSCTRLGTDMMQLAQHCSEGVYGKEKLNSFGYLASAQIWDHLYAVLHFPPGFEWEVMGL